MNKPAKQGSLEPPPIEAPPPEAYETEARAGSPQASQPRPATAAPANRAELAPRPRGSAATPAALSAPVQVGTTLVPRRTSTADAKATREAALVQARLVIALQRPRNYDEIRQRLVALCRDRLFAEKAFYRKPQKRWDPATRKMVDDALVDFSIRFVETVLGVMGQAETRAWIEPGEEENLVCVTVMDYATNVSHALEGAVRHTVERRNGSGREVVATRQNSYGDTVYICVATEEEMRQREMALASKMLRVCGLRVIPAELKAECEDEIRKTREKALTENPAAARNAIADRFLRIGVSVSELERYTGAPWAQATAADLTDLEGVLNAIAEGENRWADALADKLEGAEPERPAATHAATGQTAADALKADLKASR